jgi:hypothetical protein
MEMGKKAERRIRRETAAKEREAAAVNPKRSKPVLDADERKQAITYLLQRVVAGITFNR